MNRAEELQDQVVERFVGDTAEHQLEVRRDDDLYKHLVFKRPGSSMYRYDLVTWPGFLCFCGDMGTLVFTREPDMLAWFRNNPDRDLGKRINPDYWSQKLCDDGGRQVRDFDAPSFKTNVLQWISQEWTGLSDEDTEKLHAAVEEEIFRWSPSNAHEAYEALTGFEFQTESGREWRFEDAYEMDNTQYEFRFIWACLAIVQGIDWYDNHLAAEAVAEGRSAAIDAANAGA